MYVDGIDEEREIGERIIGLTHLLVEIFRNGCFRRPVASRSQRPNISSFPAGAAKSEQGSCRSSTNRVSIGLRLFLAVGRHNYQINLIIDQVDFCA
jgi:hypothetical protein